MKYDEVQKILRTTNASDWITDEERGRYTYRDDLSLRIQCREIDFDTFFDEQWATRHPDKKAHKVDYDVFYNCSFVKTVTLVSVDGGRATIPMPEKYGSSNILEDDYRFATIVSPERLDEYIQRSGLIIPNLEEKD